MCLRFCLVCSSVFVCMFVGACEVICMCAVLYDLKSVLCECIAFCRLCLGVVFSDF